MEQKYLPLFRKYRPQSFADVVGQENLTKALSNAIELNRIANAYLFCGPRGTGKTSSARIFAKSLNCEHGPTLTPCQKCPSCLDITNATGLDVIEIDAASNRGIQDAKELISQVQYAPINGKYKIFIIDEVHMLSNDAFNALLKTFEEPPLNVIFILATTEPHKVLETIVSRCQRFDLRRITTEDIVKRLREISELENIKISIDALYTIAKNVSGGLRDSLALLDQVSILGIKEEISKELIEELLGKINFEILFNLLNNINNEDIENAVKCVNEIYANGNEPRNLAENFIEFLRNVILVLNSKDASNIKNFTTLLNENIEKINNANFDKDKISKILNVIIDYYKEIKISTNPYLWMELAVISASKLTLSNNAVNIPEKINTQNIQKSIATPKQTIATPKTEPSVNSSVQNDTVEIKQEIKQEVFVEDIKEEVFSQKENSIVSADVAKNQDGAQIWMNVIAKIPSLPARAFYSGVAKLIKVENNKIYLGFLHENALAQAKSDMKLSQLKTAIAETYPNFELEFNKISSDVQIIEVKPKLVQAPPVQPKPVFSPQQNPISASDAQNSESEDEEETNKAEKQHYSHKVQEMIEQYNGRIIE